MRDQVDMHGVRNLRQTDGPTVDYFYLYAIYEGGVV
jgi:hypothetical protein